MATQVAMQNSGSYSIGQFQSRMIRWPQAHLLISSFCLHWNSSVLYLYVWNVLWWPSPPPTVITYLIYSRFVFRALNPHHQYCLWYVCEEMWDNLIINDFRWTKLRINMLPGTVLEPISECFLASLIIGWAAHYVFRYAANHRSFQTCWKHIVSFSRPVV